MEMSHRSQEFLKIVTSAQDSVRQLLLVFLFNFSSVIIAYFKLDFKLRYIYFL